MKKSLTLVLALFLVIGLSMPAMAFTSDDQPDDESIPFELSIYLVEYDDNDFFGITTLPESDRGYAKNEIVAAVVELDVPEDEFPGDDYGSLVFGGENVDLDVTDNNFAGAVAALTCAGLPTSTDAFTLDDDELIRNGGAAYGDDETYKWLFFAKVTDDEASLYAKLIDGDGSVGFDEDDELEVTLDGVDYSIELAPYGIAGDVSILISFDHDNVYRIDWSDDDGEYRIMIFTDEDYKSTGMVIGINNDDYAHATFDLGVNTKGELGIMDGAVVETSGDDFDEVMDIYEDVVVGVFGLDYFNIGNYVRKSFFEDLVSPDTLIATVDIEPWTAYVSIPDNIVVDPPKTGDMASIVGFAMVALAGSSAVILKKRG